MMNDYGTPNAGNTALTSRYQSEANILALVAQSTGRATGPLASISDADLFSAGAVRVQAVARPVYGAGLTFGQRTAEDLSGEKFGADPWEWRQLWTVIPGTVPDAKAELRALLRVVQETYIELLSTGELAYLRELEVAQYARDHGTPVESEYPAIQALAAAEAITFTTAVTWLEDNLQSPHSAQVEQHGPTFLGWIDRVQKATTLTELEDIYDELQAFLTP